MAAAMTAKTTPSAATPAVDAAPPDRRIVARRETPRLAYGRRGAMRGRHCTAAHAAHRQETKETLAAQRGPAAQKESRADEHQTGRDARLRDRQAVIKRTGAR